MEADSLTVEDLFLVDDLEAAGSRIGVDVIREAQTHEEVEKAREGLLWLLTEGAEGRQVWPKAERQ